MKTPLAFYCCCVVFLLLFAVENVAGQGCSSSPCLNDGSCFEFSTGFVCSCSSDFTGVTCEKALDEGPVCEFNSCANRGVCIITDGAVKCNCTTDYTGPLCDTPVNIIVSKAITSTPTITTKTEESSQELTSETEATSQTIRQTTSSSIPNLNPTVCEPKSLAIWIIVLAVSVVVGLCAAFLFGVIVGSKRRGNRNDSDTEKNCKSKESTAIYSRTIENIEDGEKENSKKQQLQTYETLNNNRVTVAEVASNAVKQEAMSSIVTRDHMYSSTIVCEDSL